MNTIKTVAFALAAAAAALAAAPAHAVEPGGDKGTAQYKLGIAGYTFCRKSLDDTLKTMQAIDAHYLCVKDFHLKIDCTQEEADAFREKLAKAGVKAVAVGPVYSDSEAGARKAFEWARKLGIKVVVGIPLAHRETGELDQNGKPKKVNVESDEMLDVIEKLVKEYDMFYAIHNHGPDMPELYPNADAVMKRIANRDRRIGLCLDIGHEFRFGFNASDSIRKYGDRIYDVHLKNVSSPNRAGHAMQLPRGAMDLVDIAKALKEVGYKGALHLEYERDFDDNAMGLAESIGYFRGVMDSLR